MNEIVPGEKRDAGVVIVKQDPNTRGGVFKKKVKVLSHVGVGRAWLLKSPSFRREGQNINVNMLSAAANTLANNGGSYSNDRASAAEPELATDLASGGFFHADYKK